MRAELWVFIVGGSPLHRAVAFVGFYAVNIAY